MGSDVRDAVARATQSMRRRASSTCEGLRRVGSKVTVEGEGNVLDLGKARLHGARIGVRGHQNVVRFHPICKLVNVSFRLVGDHVWFGARPVVLKGVRIGANSVIATGSIVSRDVCSGVVAGGVPANEIRHGVT